MSGARSYYAGLAAEQHVAGHYGRAGSQLKARRWRGRFGGEIDLIVVEGQTIVFIEVKASRTHRQAADHLTHRQLSRIFISAEEYVSSLPAPANVDMRFDVALVDASGQIEILKNAYFFDGSGLTTVDQLH